MDSEADFPDFAWSVGEEGSDPIVISPEGPVRQDQFAQSGHFDHLERDLADVAALGISVFRYGMPWRLTEAAPGRYDWRLWDRALRGCEAVGLEPVVDLLHFGLPDHHPLLSDPEWVDGFVRYVEAFLGRYRDLRWFTPINEPGITALLSARFGLWNDRLASAEAHARTLANVVLANLEALQRIHADRAAVWVGSEGFDVPVAVGPDGPAEVARRRALGWLVWDLHFGLEPQPEAQGYLDPVDDHLLDRIAALATRERLVAGLDFYPTSVQAVGGPGPSWSTTELVDLGAAEMERWHDRYQVPFWVAETSNLSLPVTEQVPWLAHLTASLARLRGAGRPVRGLCWYSRGDQLDWQTALANPTGAVTEVGLFDRHRRPRPVAATFASLAAVSG